ncbi:MAG: hypothetical protein IKI56_06985 [Ruminococcus sp.]|jgi:hypothetical protein|nr:hypothetical protein [Ruminococcus sp.]
MKINVIGGQLERSEIDAYLKYVSEKYTGRQIRQLDIVIDGEFIDLKVHFSDMDFQRAFRSADYLVNSMEKLNDAKQSEFSQKQRHKTEE